MMDFVDFSALASMKIVYYMRQDGEEWCGKVSTFKFDTANGNTFTIGKDKAESLAIQGRDAK